MRAPGIAGHSWARLEQGWVDRERSLGDGLGGGDSKYGVGGFLKGGTQTFSFCLFASPFLLHPSPYPHHRLWLSDFPVSDLFIFYLILRTHCQSNSSYGTHHVTITHNTSLKSY